MATRPETGAGFMASCRGLLKAPALSEVGGDVGQSQMSSGCGQSLAKLAIAAMMPTTTATIFQAPSCSTAV